ncbi:hypothetical protein HPP92_018173 [Vanilla planifolia]|uniref:Photosystem II 5 kDa protein, chloroplastic n=1 Tax=Vanilla planifolia TaxID=51239 RepID=A0A835Q9B2_VANPL|nr:hypothetical protein HPP92_018173 [Vanilla planifolia]
MASTLSVAPSFLGTARPSPANRRRLVVAKATAGPREASVSREPEQDGSGRRGVMLAAAAAAICAAGSVQWSAAVAEEEPKRGTPEAKKKYAPICVTMPTASICHK